jgi:hypothetical protein
LSGFLVLPARGGQRIESYYIPGPELQLESRWLIPHLRPGSDSELMDMTVAESAFTELRLVVPQAFVGKRVRIDAILPAFAQGVEGSRGLEVEWRTQGVFRPGKLRMGERAPLFEGVVGRSILSDRVAYIVRMDARYVAGPVRFETVYEIEELP